MAENNVAQPAVSQQERSRRDAFMERFGRRYPNVDAGDEEAFYGVLGDEWDRMDRSDEAQRELGDLLANDPRSAGFLMVMRKGGNPMEYLIEQYGDDFREALNDEGKAREFAEAFSKYTEKQAKNKELQAQAEANMQKMLDDLDAAKTEGQFTDEDAEKAYSYLYGDGGLLDRIITNDINRDDWMMLMKAANYDLMRQDADARVADARRAGEVAGRNANIELNRRRRNRTAACQATSRKAGVAVKADAGKTRCSPGWTRLWGVRKVCGKINGTINNNKSKTKQKDERERFLQMVWPGIADAAGHCVRFGNRGMHGGRHGNGR